VREENEKLKLINRDLQEKLNQQEEVKHQVPQPNPVHGKPNPLQGSAVGVVKCG
jgi:regulator of replication initiation timing